MQRKKYILYLFLALIIGLAGYIKYHNLNINDIALKTLSWVKKIKGDAVDLSDLDQSQNPIIYHDAWTTLLQKHVSSTGQVNYKGFIEDKSKLEDYLAKLSAHSPGSNWPEADQLAYWINAYNAFTVKLIIDHYPLKSIKDITSGIAMINSPWDIKFFKIGQINFDLNTIEHEILRKQFNEPRIHFAVNCASVSCPILRKEAYTADQLEQQLEEQTRLFLNDPEKNRIDASSTKLSKIFSWFKSDFIRQGSLKSFIALYNDTFNYDNKIEYLDYDWGLNE